MQEKKGRRWGLRSWKKRRGLKKMGQWLHHGFRLHPRPATTLSALANVLDAATIATYLSLSAGLLSITPSAAVSPLSHFAFCPIETYIPRHHGHVRPSPYPPACASSRAHASRAKVTGPMSATEFRTAERPTQGRAFKPIPPLRLIPVCSPTRSPVRAF
ncbi:hypothetical protein CRG98_013428 [Punica granatum]|uniref:Uncharacterized protein n=1 Tax=Punica granatum TaxID=22663 RepID=A0A2I0KCA6_PUNGR|nr:hypothetical protein CRG98_013428 [Punica granatum]